MGSCDGYGSELREVDTNDFRRKRQKTSSPDVDGVDELRKDFIQPTLENVPVVDSVILSQDIELNIPNASQTLTAAPKMSRSTPEWSNGAPKEHLPGKTSPSPKKPRRTLMFNSKTGTIGSPPTRQAAKGKDKELAVPAKRRKRLKIALVKIAYGIDEATKSRIGNKITRILSSEAGKSVNLSLNPITNPFSRMRGRSDKSALKSTHPFFLGKITSNPEPMVETDETTDGDRSQPNSQTEIVAKLPKISFASPAAFNRMRAELPLPAIKTQHAFGVGNKILKFPGAIEPIWPPNGMVHVRDDIGESFRGEFRTTMPKKYRKYKYTCLDASPEEDVIAALALSLDSVSIQRDLRDQSKRELGGPVIGLHLPQKHFESGARLQERIRCQLRSDTKASTVEGTHDHLSEDQLQSPGKHRRKPHPAVSRVYRSISTSLSAFDRSAHETQSWTQKYSPGTAADVLQTGREAFILKEWLQALTVVSVESGSTDAEQIQSNSRKGGEIPRKKRKSKLDDFVVSSDEDEDGMTEVSDPDDSDQLHDSSKRTMIRAKRIATNLSEQQKKIPNTVVISGPHGCGKTAMVYAVAKELGFDIFEINAGSRRSGKDITDRVGDMTRNHLVQGSSSQRSTATMEDSTTVTGVAGAPEVSRQDSVISFFKAKVAKTTSKKDNAAVEQEARKSRPPPKEQRQSLILLEEADLLYEEDKQFWPTVITLMVQSKRPIIITCNNESLIPLQTFSLHAIIRLSRPPVDLAVDYSLLVAANEGHSLQRKDVQGLYMARGRDLRACLTELETWCQLGVGDRKGGLEWFIPRWPRGCDKDEYGNVTRVISQGTYRQAIDWLGQANARGCNSISDNESVLQDAWKDWQIHPECLLSGKGAHTLQEDRVIGLSLAEYAEAVDLMSAADVCSNNLLSNDPHRVTIDPTTPTLTHKSKNDYVLGYGLLQADDGRVFDTLAREIALCLMASASFHRDESLVLRKQIIAKITDGSLGEQSRLNRRDFSIAFDPIANGDGTSIYTSSLEPSVFDRTIGIIAIDVSPYVRSIVNYDNKLREERVRLNGLLSDGGRPGKRMRTTRAALSALEGGARRTTRKEKYFKGPLDTTSVLRTGMPHWLEVAHDAEFIGGSPE